MGTIKSVLFMFRAELQMPYNGKRNRIRKNLLEFSSKDMWTFIRNNSHTSRNIQATTREGLTFPTLMFAF
jgi:hypothetical protein